MRTVMAPGVEPDKLDPRKLFDNGWAFALIFLIAGGSLMAWQHSRGPWMEASAVVPGGSTVVRYRVKPAMLPGLAHQREIIAVRAGRAATTLLKNKIPDLPLVLMSAGNQVVIRDSHGNEWNLETKVADTAQLALVGIFVEEGGLPLFLPRHQRLTELELQFSREDVEIPTWVLDAWNKSGPAKKKTVNKAGESPDDDGEAIETLNKERVKSRKMWKDESEFLEELLRQHAPGLFSEYRVPGKVDRLGAWLEKPRKDGSPRFFARGDFNGDHLKDFAFILPRLNGGFSVLALVSTKDREYKIHRLSQGEGRPQRFSIDSARPGIYKAAGAYRSNLENPNQEGEIAIDRDSLRLSQMDQWSSILYWNSDVDRFEDVAVNE